MGIINWLFGHKCNICGKSRTKKRLDDGRYICEYCELKMEADREQRRLCPACLKKMKKEIIEGIIIDRCESHGVWLDKGELERIKDMAEESESSSHMMGLCLGLSLGSAMHSHS